ncbi:hypothetical protein GGS23DRAFT_361454 [Durotheca rogersii]|uniref:uncharacterized protein n=1 Tax=Durotheca rogersii TaxID=419775 RepID=UPI00221E847D|nr:uncharacterized protein GGS23DRAFT_361454 [Durotheca rogersii]KAI5865942.1 hypothetical protein GGS23DRAFT_361454 [Durotheca rogersii]
MPTITTATTLRTASRAGARALLRQPTAGRRLLATTAALPTRPSAAARAPYKDDMDRESLKPRSRENTQSGTDDEVAAKRDAAYGPHKTDPDTERRAAAAESDGNPLDESPANKEFAEAGRGHAEDKPVGPQKQRKASGFGDAPEKGRPM